jgi:hypothetical protein
MEPEIRGEYLQLVSIIQKTQSYPIYIVEDLLHDFSLLGDSIGTETETTVTSCKGYDLGNVDPLSFSPLASLHVITSP